jgi:hypothetical protein
MAKRRRSAAGPSGIIEAIDATMREMYPKTYAEYGAPDAKAIERLRAEVPHAPAILVELYRWKNGGSDFLALHDDTSAMDWLPLAAAFDKRDALAKNDLPARWFPVFDSTDGAYACIDETGALAYFDTQGEAPHRGVDSREGDVEPLERALEIVHENMLAERWRFGREAKDEADLTRLLEERKSKALAEVDKAEKRKRPADWVRALDILGELVLVHRRPEALRPILTELAPRLPAGLPGANIRARFWLLQLDACQALGLEAEAIEAAQRASAGGDSAPLGRVASWLVSRGSHDRAAEALASAAKRRPDPWAVGLACTLARMGDTERAKLAATEALAAIDKLLGTLTEPHHGTARAGAKIRRAVALAARGERDAARETLAGALAEVPPSPGLDSIKSDPLWIDVVKGIE